MYTICYAFYIIYYIIIIMFQFIFTTIHYIYLYYFNLYSVHLYFSIKQYNFPDSLEFVAPYLSCVIWQHRQPVVGHHPPGRGRALHLRRVSALAYLLMKSTTSWHETPRSLTQEWGGELNSIGGGGGHGRWQRSESLLNFAQLINLSPRPGGICRWLTPLIGPQIEGS